MGLEPLTPNILRDSPAPYQQLNTDSTQLTAVIVLKSYVYHTVIYYTRSLSMYVNCTWGN